MSQLRLEMNTLQKQIYTDTATPICSVEPAIIKEHEVSKKLRHIICTKYLFKISTFCHSKTNKQTNFTKDQNHFLWIFLTEKSSKILSNLIWSPTALHTGNMNIYISVVVVKYYICFVCTTSKLLLQKQSF